MWQVLSNQGVVNEDLPDDLIGALKECHNLVDAIESSTSPNVHQPLSSYNREA